MEVEDSAASSSCSSSAAAAAAALKPVTHDLRSFTLKPPDRKGMKLFEHMCKMRCRSAGAHYTPSDHLALEFTDKQINEILPTRRDLAARDILADAGGSGATQKLLQRKLDTAGGVKAFCEVANNPARTRELEQAVALSLSLAQIGRVTAQEKAKKAAAAAADQKRKAENAAIAKGKRMAEEVALTAAAPAALAKLQKADGALEISAKLAKLQKAEMRALLLKHGGRFVANVTKKATLVDALTALFAVKPELLVVRGAQGRPQRSTAGQRARRMSLG